MISTEKSIFDYLKCEYYPKAIFPSTRYQGSKKKIADWIINILMKYNFFSALDAFGGTGAISHMLKNVGKIVYYNDILRFNYIIGKALIENSFVKLADCDVEYILTRHNTIEYKTIISDNFSNIYYTDEENNWLDMVVGNIKSINNEYKRALAYFALFQSCIIKRPYNLFHRANLYVRLNNDVKRSFGNKTTWDKPFESHFIKFVNEGNNAIFDNGYKCFSYNCNATDINGNYDLVYIDTPYISDDNKATDYYGFYHFLEGISDYDNWELRLDKKYKHLPLISNAVNPWCDKELIYGEFNKLFSHYSNSILAVSYRADGIPSVDELCDIMRTYKKNINIFKSNDYKYALSNKTTNEMLIIGS